MQCVHVCVCVCVCVCVLATVYTETCYYHSEHTVVCIHVGVQRCTTRVYRGIHSGVLACSACTNCFEANTKMLRL